MLILFIISPLIFVYMLFVIGALIGLIICYIHVIVHKQEGIGSWSYQAYLTQYEDVLDQFVTILIWPYLVVRFFYKNGKKMLTSLHSDICNKVKEKLS